MKSAMIRLRMLAPAIALTIAACGATPDGQATNADPGHGASSANDPVLRAALRDQIMVGPDLVQQANADTIRPPAQPETGALPPDGIATIAAAVPGKLRAAPPPAAACPLCAAARRSITLGALAESQGVSAQCVAGIGYAMGWANRLPAGVPLYPDARVAEAAGADGAGCALRAVSFASAAPMQRMLDWYYTRGAEAGYRATHQADGVAHVLAGRRPDDKGMFMVVLKPRHDGGTDVDLLADGGV